MKTTKSIVYNPTWGVKINVPAGREMRLAKNLPEDNPSDPQYFLGGWRGMNAVERGAVRQGILVRKSEVR